MNISNILWFITQSIYLDVNFLSISRWNFVQKIDFLNKKYFLIVRHFIKKFTLGSDSINFFGKQIYYDSVWGLAGYQSLLVRHQFLLSSIAHIDTASTIIDVGANVGFFSMLCRDLYPNSEIYSFEPIPITFKCLKNNFRYDTKTHVVNMAVTNKNGKVKMGFNPEDSAISSINPKGDFEVKTTKLDTFTEKNKIYQIDILKVDTESFENLVLLGGFKILSKTKYLFIEVTLENNPNYTFSSLFSHLYSDKFNFQLIGYRAYSDKSMGATPIFDMVLENTLF